MVSVGVRLGSTIEYKWQAALIVALGLFLSVLDSTIVSVALPAMRQTFSTDFDTITWVVTAYFLAQAAVIPITGALNDRYGTKYVFLLALAVFIIGSALCVVAPTRDALIGARVVQGLGGGALFPTSFAIAYRAFPRAEWGRATTIIGVPVLLAPALGPVLGGWLTSAYDWRVIFAINLPLGVAALVAAAAILRARADDDETETDGPEDEQQAGIEGFDLKGFVLSAGGFTVLVFGLTEAGLHGWGNALVIWSLVAGLFLLAVLVVVELRVQTPVLDVRLFSNMTFVVAGLLIWLVAAFYYGSLFLIPFYFEKVHGYSAMTAGEIMISQGVASAIGIAFGGELYHKIGPKPLAVVGTGALALSMLGFTRLSLDSTGLSLQVWLALRGLGLGLVTIPMQNLALAAVRRREVARASSLINVVRQAAGAAGLAVMAAYLSQQSAAHIKSLTAALQSRGAYGYLTINVLQRKSIVMGLNDTFTLVLVACVVTFVLAAFVGRDPARVQPKAETTSWLAAIFPDLSEADVVEAASRARTLTYDSGQVIVREGDEADNFYIITAGQVCVTGRSAGMREREMRKMGSGEFFGEIGLLAERPRTATVTTTQPTQLLVIDRDAFSRIVGGSEKTAQNLREIMWQRLAIIP